MAGSDEARRLLAKAADDEYVLDRLLDDAAAPDSIVGFHAQQAAEKLLKAALFSAGVAPPAHPQPGAVGGFGRRPSSAPASGMR
jgi:hypothetical protein